MAKIKMAVANDITFSTSAANSAKSVKVSIKSK